MSSWLFCTYKLVKNWPGIHFGGFPFETIHLSKSMCMQFLYKNSPPFPYKKKVCPLTKNMLVFKFQNLCIPKIMLISKLPQKKRRKRESYLNAWLVSKLQTYTLSPNSKKLMYIVVSKPQKSGQVFNGH